MIKTRKIYVVGAGVMGNGIAQVVAESGYEVKLYDLREEIIDTAMANIEKSLERFVKKGKKTKEDKSSTLARISPSLDLADASDSDFVIEAAFEELAVKEELFKELDRKCKKEAILGTNTSSLPISYIAAATTRREKVIGTHFMNPVPLMQGVEIIPGIETSEDTINTTKELVRSFGKEPVVARDYAGFIASRVLDVMLNEAVRCVMDGNEPQEIDKTMKFCCNFPMGPLELIDLAGADILLHVLETMEKEYGDRYHPAPLLRQMVRAGHLGRKAGKGFYEYSK